MPGHSVVLWDNPGKSGMVGRYGSVGAYSLIFHGVHGGPLNEKP